MFQRHRGKQHKQMKLSLIFPCWWGGDRGAGARENRGREGYGRRERKGREAGVQRGREAGEKCETLFFFKFNNALQYFQKQEPKLYLTCI